MHPYSDYTTGFLGIIYVFNNLGKSVVLIVYCQLPFLQSEATISKQSGLDWGAIGSCDLSSVLDA